MQIRVGYDLTYTAPAPTPMIAMLTIHHSRANDLIVPDRLICDPPVPTSGYRDTFGNWCTRLVAPPGPLRLSCSGIVQDSGLPDVHDPYAMQHKVEDLPAETLLYLLGSRYCETDRLTDIAWQLFGHTPLGWARVQAICDYVYNHLTFGYQFARSTRTAWEGWNERQGVCRDFAHLALTFCRCMNIPARYCTGYLGDIGVPISDSPMDFSGWFEVWLGNRWYTFDARHNMPRIGRVLIATGRDAADVAITTTFGPNMLTHFSVVTDELT